MEYNEYHISIIGTGKGQYIIEIKDKEGNVTTHHTTDATLYDDWREQKNGTDEFDFFTDPCKYILKQYLDIKM